MEQGFPILPRGKPSFGRLGLPGGTLPETNSSPLKMAGWKTIYFPFQKRDFQGRTVSFREGTSGVSPIGSMVMVYLPT